jgi:hypothetical protein
MQRRCFLLLVIALASIAAVCAQLSAQAAQDASAAGIKIKPIPARVPPMPFPPGSEAPGRVHSIKFIAADQMSEKDRLLEADAESSIHERAGWAGLEFNQGQWSYRQLVCPALPNHLFLQFTRNNGVGDVSLFSASIPRNGEGRVRIIPIQRRGYSLFSPAPINALTISAFNHIRAEEHAGKAPGWLTTGLCYAALAGAHPEAVLLPEEPKDQKYPAASAAMMTIPSAGGAIIQFADVAATPRPMQWTMSFNGKGRLLKATHTPAPLITAKAIPQVVIEAKGKPLPQAVIDLNAKQTP